MLARISAIMSIYDNRLTPAYGKYKDEVSCPNPHILRWWTAQHDALILEQIRQFHWNWALSIRDEILKLTKPCVIEEWRNTDPECKRRVGYNALRTFAESRAHQVGLTKGIRAPQRKTCPLCSCEFLEDSLPYPLIVRLGMDGLDFCAPCLATRVLQNTGIKDASEESCLTYIRELTDALQRIPPQGFGTGRDDFLSLGRDERLRVLRLFGNKPSDKRVAELFGSWFHALIKSGVLDEDAQRMARGIRCLAKDGHCCLSLGEKTIDDTLFSLGISHEKEPRYPVQQYRADFLVNGTFIEYFGLAGDSDYDERTRIKKEICLRHGLRLIALYPNDLMNSVRLEKKLLALLA